MSKMIVPLKEIGKIVKREVEIKTTEEYKTVGCRLYGLGVYEREKKKGYEIQANRMFLIKQNDFLTNRIWAQKGSLGIVPEELDGAVVSNDFPVVELDLAKILPSFLGFYIKTKQFWSECRKYSHGTSGRERLSPSKLLDIEIPLPPLDEQKHTVATIGNLLEKLEEVRKIRQEAIKQEAEIIDSQMVKLVLQVKKDQSQKHLGDYVVDCCYGTSEKTNDDISGIPILRMGNIQNGELLLKDLKYLYMMKESNLLLRKGDVLINRTNSAELVGKCAVFDIDGEYSFASYLIRLRLDTTKVLPQYVAMYINSSLGKAYIAKEKKQMTGQANINSQKLKALPIFVPSLLVQRQILSQFDSLQAKAKEIISLRMQTEQETEELVSSVLEKAFG